MTLLDAIHQRTATCAVLGLGYVGLPLALKVAGHGFPTIGIDSDEEHVAKVNRGQSPLLDISAEELQHCLKNKRFHVTTDVSTLSSADIVVICVPTPLRHQMPDMSFIEAAAVSIGQFLRKGQLIVLESTSYPGTTEDLLRVRLEASGLKAGLDFSLGFSPERIDPGVHFVIEEIPKIVGGIDEQSTLLMEAFYKTFIPWTVRVSSPTTAEMAKLLENTYRHVNIALANEMAILCHDLGIDVWEVIDAAATKPFGFQAFYPGPGCGGHCIPIDPAYLSWRVRQLGDTARFIQLASEINDRMPQYVVARIVELLNQFGMSLKGSRILILGVAYKRDVADVRESPALDIISRLIRLGAEVRFHDPHVPSVAIGSASYSSVPGYQEALSQADLVVITTDHTAYDWKLVASSALRILDTRNALRGLPGPIERL